MRILIVSPKPQYFQGLNSKHGLGGVAIASSSSNRSMAVMIAAMIPSFSFILSL
jgi:hypothetical protein